MRRLSADNGDINAEKKELRHHLYCLPFFSSVYARFVLSCRPLTMASKMCLQSLTQFELRDDNLGRTGV